MARKILLADDSVTAQNMGRKILADAGYEVVTVNNGSAALKRIAELKPDLIVLDVYMPGYSGLEVCQRLKDAEETARIPVLLTVGKLEPFKAEEARRVGADAHIVKPFEASELLTAISRLEDRIAQFAENGAVQDSGWASRLSFPSKRKREAAEPEDVGAGAAFRDFRKGKNKTGGSGAFSVKASPLAQHSEIGRGPATDIPRDITPEELDALSALAAKLDGSNPAAEDTAPPKKQEVEAPKQVVEAPAPVVEPATAATFAIEPEAFAVAGNSDVETPAEPMPSAVVPVLVADPAVVQVPKPGLDDSEDRNSVSQVSEKQVSEKQTSENGASENECRETLAPLAEANAVPLTQESALADRNDEPMFASAGSAVTPALEQAAEDKSEGNPAEPETPAPSDRELAEALSLLTPATGHADGSAVPSQGVLSAQGTLPAEESAHPEVANPEVANKEVANHEEVVPRWVAEPVALSPDEATISLEAEMFRTFAAIPSTMLAPSSTAEFEAPRTSVSAIAAAVESRLAEAGLAVGSQALAVGADSSSDTIAVSKPASPVIASPVIDGVEAQTEAENKAGDAPVPAMVAEQVVTEQISAEEIVAKVEEAPKAMAAAAAAQGSGSASDARTIANIVDSVLADLRPKIIEEIAKKMAGK